MKILHVSESIKGGCGTYLNEIVPVQARQFGPESIRVVVPLQHLDHLTLDRSLVLPFERPSRKVGLAHLFLAFLRAYMVHRPDIIHLHSTFSGLIVRAMRPFIGAPIVYCPHGWAFDVQMSPVTRALARLAERTLAKSCDRIVAISAYEHSRGIRLGIPPHLLETIPNGIRLAPPQASPAAWDDSRLKVLFVGRLDSQKGFDILLKSVAGLDDAVCVRVAGGSVVRSRALDRAVHPNIHHLGWLTHEGVASHMAACDVVVMPSRWEGFGLVAIEAMRLRKPVIASSVGGLREIVVHAETGYLVTPEDHRVLRDQILSLDQNTLRELGEAGHRRFVRYFTADRANDQIVSLYQDVLRRRERR